MAAVLLVVCGITASSLSARTVARADANRSKAAFIASSGEVVSTLQLSLQNLESLVVHASAYFLEHPQASHAEFGTWLTAVRAFERYPELGAAAVIAMVDAQDLPAFAARALLDPARVPDADGSYHVTPPGERPFYCLLAVLHTRVPGLLLPPGFDYCAETRQRDRIVVARDSGESTYNLLPDAVGGGLSIMVPMYGAAVIPDTIAARREAFDGVLAIQLDPAMVLERALQGRSNMAVTLRHHDAFSDAQFSSGTTSPHAQSIAADLGDGWAIGTSGEVASGRVSDHPAALIRLVAGIALSALLAALLFVLATGRARAMRLVSQRTGELRYQALHDALTGLPNRALIMDRIEQLLARNRRHGTSGAALFVDLDDFKNINDTLGHEAGDRLLMAVAERLTSALRDADTIGRMGGDEFVVLIDGATLDVAPELIAERLLEVMRQPFVLGGASMPLAVNTSVGIAMGDRANPGDLLRDADVALYQAKAAGKNRYEIFHAEMQSEIVRRVELEFDLRSALEADQFRLVYQPIYNLEDLTIVGVEALLRWDHPHRGVVQPDDFIPILERSGQVNDVGRWVLGEACHQMARWHATGNTLDLSVNVSGRQLDHDGIIDDVRHALEHSGLDPSRLIIEVSETELMRNTHETTRRLRGIKHLGVRIAVDDFGTGYSSLAYLQQFPVDCLKIDRMFTNAITTSPESRALIGTLVQLGKDLGLRTLAEGVETTDEMDSLRAELVDEAQGFLLSRPLDPRTLETQLLHRDIEPRRGIVRTHDADAHALNQLSRS